jgi:AhpD family alkylhydroperoxidase
MPAYIAALENIGSMVRHAGPLDERTIQLLQIAASAAIRSEGAVHSHTRRALEAEATPAEIRHALLCLTSTIGFPGVAAALSWVGDELGHLVDPASARESRPCADNGMRT